MELSTSMLEELVDELEYKKEQGGGALSFEDFQELEILKAKLREQKQRREREWEEAIGRLPPLAVRMSASTAMAEVHYANVYGDAYEDRSSSGIEDAPSESTDISPLLWHSSAVMYILLTEGKFSDDKRLEAAEKIAKSLLEYDRIWSLFGQDKNNLGRRFVVVRRHFNRLWEFSRTKTGMYLFPQIPQIEEAMNVVVKYNTAFTQEEIEKNWANGQYNGHAAFDRLDDEKVKDLVFMACQSTRMVKSAAKSSATWI